jgi:hypothetical protein
MLLTFTLSFKYSAIESASSGPSVHSRIFLAQYILQKTHNTELSNDYTEPQIFLDQKCGK